MQLRLACFTILLQAGVAVAQPHVTLSAPKDAKIDNLTPVVASDARHVSLSESLNLLAFCHGQQHTDAHVSLVKLDAKGNPAPYAISWKLPRPAGLDKTPNYALSTAFHPKLPLLYVWQDLATPYNVPTIPPPKEYVGLDHLLIYSIAKEPPELLASLCRGDEYMYGMQGAGLAVDKDAAFLYVPNMRQAKNASFLHFGRTALDADGLPFVDEATSKLPSAARAKKLTELNAAKPWTPKDITPLEYVYLFPQNQWGCGHSFVPLNKDVVLAGGINGLISWRPDDVDTKAHGVPLKGQGHTLVCVHPTLPAVFASGHATTDHFFRAEHAEGYLTLMPRRYTIPETRLGSPPVLLAKGTRLALGGHYHVYLVNLDKDGVPTGEVQRARVFDRDVRALAYSERYDRLYVGVEVSK